MALVEIRWRPDSRELRKFGLVVMIGLGLIGILFQFWAERTDVAWALYGAAGILGLPALTGTVIALPGYWLWMGFAFVMGNIMGRILLCVIYYGLITPMGIVRRMITDPLKLKRPNIDSYWTDIDDTNEKERYERLF